MPGDDLIGTLIGIGGLVLMVGWLVIALVRFERKRRRDEAARRAVLDALCERFALSPAGERAIEGRGESRTIRIAFATDYLLLAQVELARPVVPDDVQIAEFADGPYQKQEELQAGGARTGDAAFDRAFLVRGTRARAEHLPDRLRAFLLDRPLEGLQLSSRELSRPLPTEPAAAIATLEETLRYCDELEVAAGG